MVKALGCNAGDPFKRNFIIYKQCRKRALGGTVGMKLARVSQCNPIVQYPDVQGCIGYI